MFAQRLRTNGDARRGDGDEQAWGGAKPDRATFAGSCGQEDQTPGGVVTKTWAGQRCPGDVGRREKRGGATCGAELRLRGVGRVTLPRRRKAERR